MASLKRSSTVSGWFLRPNGCSRSWKVGMHRAWRCVCVCVCGGGWEKEERERERERGSTGEHT